MRPASESIGLRPLHKTSRSRASLPQRGCRGHETILRLVPPPGSHLAPEPLWVSAYLGNLRSRGDERDAFFLLDSSR